MRHHPLCLLLLLLFGVSMHADAQRFGGNRPGIRWKQIVTDTARIIFPAELEPQAMEVASLIRMLAIETTGSLGNKTRQVPVVLQPMPVVSNGYVGLAPFRSEFFMNPPSGNYQLGTLPWHLQLASHEFRHVQQYNNFNKGLSRFGSVILGEEGQALLNAAAIPDWFFEGDAVHQETTVSEQGRGRVPYFFNEFKVLKDAAVPYQYMQLRNGSYRHLYPDHYRLGYLLVGYGYEKYGQDFWKKVTDDAARFRSLFYPLQKAVKKHAGIPFSSFVEEAIQFYHLRFNNRSTKEKRAKFLKEQVNPQPWSADSVVWHRQTNRDIPAFFLQTSRGMQKIKTRQIGTDDYFSQRNGRLVYTRYAVHPRWSWTEYSDVVLFDLHSKQEKKITRHQRYFSPDINEEGTLIAVVEITSSGVSRLVLMNTSGEVQKTIAFPAQLQTSSSAVSGIFTHPKFDGDSAIVTGLRFSNGKNALASISLSSGNTRLLTPPSFQVTGIAQPGEAYIYSNASLQGEDRIIRIHRATGTVSALADSTRSYSPVAEGNQLHFSRFTINGMRPGQLDISSGSWTTVLPAEWETTNLYLKKSLGEKQDITANISDVFPVKKYRKGTRLINIHSWRPFFEASELSFTLYGQNVLNTFQSEAAYTYNTNEGSHAVRLTGVYGGLFTYISGNTEYTMNRNALSNNARVYWNEWSAALGLQVPLQFNEGRFYRNLSLSSSLNNRSVFFTGAAKAVNDNLHFNFWRGTVSYSAQIQQAIQHIFPRFAYAMRLDYQSILNKYTGNQFLATAGLYLPGIHKTHSLVFTGAIHQRDSAGDYSFSNNFPYARGFTSENLYRMRKVSANYHFPLLYPDWGFGNMLYFLRVRANLFYDYSRVGNNFRLSNNQILYLEFNQRSAGMELFFDTRWWNQLPVSFGVRYSRLVDDDIFGRKPNQFEFIVPVDLF